MFKRIALTLVALLTLTSSALAKDIVFATDATWPPMEFVGPDKEITGFAVDYMKAAGKEAGFTPVFKAVAWDGIFAGLDSGNYDAICSSVSITDERKNAMDFSTPYFKVRQALVVPKASPAKTIDDMKGKTLGAQISTTGHFAIKKVEGVKDKSYDEVGLAFEDLFNGRIDGVVCDDPVAAQYALQNDKYKDALKIASIIEAGDEFYGIAMKKGNTEVLDLVNKGIKAVQDKGIDKDLQKKWIGQ
ncbi:basic amino acid ABC transporter substrate-binding protein [Desulfolutivibrio sulfoxidireducens]|uniref:basic amino acid ABC transporter substrate-binding protein n=1 Tax=Desulfolutivibrio sulfoxidireducens TaxID=2773299 RepID=UPI00159CF766|nr:basic amino acid ABC transporter substrate-binding protein [Desulfolutivibrio sulfoxidireducens]QLA16999.1 transporter substrate-binding domain-containing protein [Desulfolutivibrio sulfoxidireducens]QLA20566.1 transporter substrate-binding domain-containing protein [Desulfolutivibrio sulfoxidireducens]